MCTVELLWIPLGAGEHVVRISGRAFEALTAFAQRRPARPLYHSALVVTASNGRYVIEMSLSPSGVVRDGPPAANRQVVWFGFVADGLTWSTDSARVLIPRSMRRIIAKSPNSIRTTPRTAVSGWDQS